MAERFLGNKNYLLYSLGMAGWSVLINMASVMLIYFYLPPSNAGLPQLVPQKLCFGIITMFSLVLASGRLFDAVTDPIIAWASDRLTSKWGRRIPFMFVSILPAALFSILLFFPFHNYESSFNYVWLFFMQLGFYLFLTVYIVPFNALMPELTRSDDEKIRMSVYLSVAFVFGIILASQVPLLSRIIGNLLEIDNIQNKYRISMGFITILACGLMTTPLFVVNEKKFCEKISHKVPLFTSIKNTLKNRNFIIFIIADSSFFITLAVISSGILYYVKVLLNLPEEKGTYFLGAMILMSLLFYPVVSRMVKVTGKKKLIIFSFAIFAMLFFSVMFMGIVNIHSELFLYSIALIAAFPVAVLGILPYAIIAEIAQKVSKEKDLKIEGMFFAVRTFGDKMGQTIGVMSFAILTILGKDPGNDFGIRLSGLFGMIICLIAALTFYMYKE